MVARVGRTHGVRGALKLYSLTEDPDSILSFQSWSIRQPGSAWRVAPAFSIDPRAGDFLIVFKDATDCDQAQRYVNAELGVLRTEFAPITNPNEYYWADLEGLQVINRQGEHLGMIDHLFETGANDVMVIRGERERLLPFVGAVVLTVDLQKREMVVDWELDW